MIEINSDESIQFLNLLKYLIKKIIFSVEYKKPLQFAVKKTDDGEPVEFRRLYKQSSDQQVINFNYESIVDFTVDVTKSRHHSTTSTPSRYGSSSEEDDSLYAEIESK